MKINTIIMDIDGTLTDGKIIHFSDGSEGKNFNVKDGLAISACIKQGIRFVVITGRQSSIVEHRMKELGIAVLFQGVRDKKGKLLSYIENNHISPGNVAYIGDDLNDLSSMMVCGFKACPADACKEVLDVSDYVSPRAGGDGAVRDIIEYIAKAQNIWDKIVESYR